jgi:hypothetical protein
MLSIACTVRASFGATTRRDIVKASWKSIRGYSVQSVGGVHDVTASHRRYFEWARSQLQCGSGLDAWYSVTPQHLKEINGTHLHVEIHVKIKNFENDVVAAFLFQPPQSSNIMMEASLRLLRLFTKITCGTNGDFKRFQSPTGRIRQTGKSSCHGLVRSSILRNHQNGI